MKKNKFPDELRNHILPGGDEENVSNAPTGSSPAVAPDEAE